MKQTPFSCLMTVLAMSLSSAMLTPVAMAAGSTIHAEVISALPAEAVVRQTLAELPPLRSAAMNIDLAKSGKSRLEASNYEWNVKLANNRRTDQLGGRFAEQEFALEKQVRWFGKYEKDVAIGDKGVVLSEAMYADQWHEAGRTLLKDWFDTLREMAGRRSLERQQQLASGLSDIAKKRVKAGEAAQLDALLADTEYQRVTALLQQAQLREEQLRQMLRVTYPKLPEPDLQRLGVPQPASHSVEEWIDKIMDDNHELELAETEAALFALQARRAASDKMPDPTIGIRAGRERDGQEKIVGISISIPLPGGGRQAESSSAYLRQKMAEERLGQVRMKVRLAAQRAVTDNIRTYQIWSTTQQIQQQSNRQASTMMSAYQLGEATLTDALNTRRMALEAELSAESAQIDSLAAQARLQLDAHLMWALD
ncbi:TolC family protein [Undibacterium sp. SXout7W]|uniref:TolC family protein n=1 Tax=Undibacterium sp. SXout7W TaxID=3413049 RepID=UPI003BF3E6C9